LAASSIGNKHTQKKLKISVPIKDLSVNNSTQLLQNGTRVINIMAQAVSIRPLTSEARVSPFGICCGENGTGTSFSPSSAVGGSCSDKFSHLISINNNDK
jgi:hypothetical protein